MRACSRAADAPAGVAAGHHRRRVGSKVLSAQEIADALRLGYESRELELEGPGNRADSHMMAKVTRAELSLGNLRDGGYAIIGIDDGNPASLAPGLDPSQRASWLAYDDATT